MEYITLQVSLLLDTTETLVDYGPVSIAQKLKKNLTLTTVIMSSLTVYIFYIKTFELFDNTRGNVVFQIHVLKSSSCINIVAHAR